MLLVVGQLLGPAALGLVDAGLHGAGHAVGVHDHPAVDVAGGAAAGLDQGAGRAQEALLVGVQDRHQRDLRQIQPLAQQVDPDQHVELAQAQIAQDLHPLDGVDVGMQVPDPHAQFAVVVGQLLGHALGQGGHQHPLAAGHGLAHLVQQVVHLAHRTPVIAGRRPDLDHRVHQAGGADDLLHEHAAALLQLVVGRGGRDVDRLVDAGLELLEVERPVVQGRRQAEAVVDQGFLAACGRRGTCRPPGGW